MVKEVSVCRRLHLAEIETRSLTDESFNDALHRLEWVRLGLAIRAWCSNINVEHPD